MEQLSAHFSADYDNLMAKLSALANQIQAAQEEEIQLDHKADFYPELSKRFIAEKSEFDKQLKVRKSSLERLGQLLDAKKTRAFTRLECPPVVDPAPQVTSAVEAINKTISEHNNRTAEFDKKRKEAFTKLEKHYAASFVAKRNTTSSLSKLRILESRLTGRAGSSGN